jgi:hypothetical protein
MFAVSLVASHYGYRYADLARLRSWGWDERGAASVRRTLFALRLFFDVLSGVYLVAILVVAVVKL